MRWGREWMFSDYFLCVTYFNEYVNLTLKPSTERISLPFYKGDPVEAAMGSATLVSPTFWLVLTHALAHPWVPESVSGHWNFFMSVWIWGGKITDPCQLDSEAIKEQVSVLQTSSEPWDCLPLQVTTAQLGMLPTPWRPHSADLGLEKGRAGILQKKGIWG